MAAVFDKVSFRWRAASVMALTLLPWRFSGKGWGVIVCAAGFSVYIFVIVCHTIKILVKKDNCLRCSCLSNLSQFFLFFLFNPLCVVLLLLFVANERSSWFHTGVIGLLAIGSGNLPCCLTAYLEKVAWFVGRLLSLQH